MLPKVPEIIHTGDRWHISQTASNEVKPTRHPHIVFFKMNLLKKQNLSNIVADVLFHRVTRMLVTVQLKLMHEDFSSSYAAFCFLWTSLEPGLKLVVLFWMKSRRPSGQAAIILSLFFVIAYTESKNAAVSRILHITEEAHELQTVQTSHFCFSSEHPTVIWLVTVCWPLEAVQLNVTFLLPLNDANRTNEESTEFGIPEIYDPLNSPSGTQDKFTFWPNAVHSRAM